MASEPKLYGHPACLIIETAQCLWEAFLDKPESFPALDQVRAGWGMVQLRYMMRDKDILNACCTGIRFARNLGTEYDDAYDWHYCPWFLENCIKVTADKNGTPCLDLVDNWAGLCAALGDAA